MPTFPASGSCRPPKKDSTGRTQIVGDHDPCGAMPKAHTSEMERQGDRRKGRANRADQYANRKAVRIQARRAPWPASRSARARVIRAQRAENLQKALEMSEANPQHIDLLVTDVVLPRASGPKLTDRLAATRQDMKVPFVSSYTADALVHGDLHRTDFAFLPNRFH